MLLFIGYTHCIFETAAWTTETYGMNRVGRIFLPTLFISLNNCIKRGTKVGTPKAIVLRNLLWCVAVSKTVRSLTVLITLPNILYRMP